MSNERYHSLPSSACLWTKFERRGAWYTIWWPNAPLKLRPFSSTPRQIQVLAFHVFSCLVCLSQPSICSLEDVWGSTALLLLCKWDPWLQDSQQNCVRIWIWLAAMNMSRRWHPMWERPWEALKPHLFHGVLCLFQPQPQQFNLMQRSMHRPAPMRVV